MVSNGIQWYPKESPHPAELPVSDSDAWETDRVSVSYVSMGSYKMPQCLEKYPSRATSNSNKHTFRILQCIANSLAFCMAQIIAVALNCFILE